MVNNKELYIGTPNLDIRVLCTVLCGRNVNKPSVPTEVEGKGPRALMIYYSPTKNKLIYQVNMIFGFLVNMENTIAINFLFPPVGPFSSKMMGSEFFVLISSHCSTRI